MSYFQPPLYRLSESQLMDASEAFGRGWFFLEWLAIRRSVSIANQLREKYPAQAQKAFRRAAIAAAPHWLARRIARNPRNWQVHHIVPLALGGGNKRRALVEDDAHLCVHAYIKPQIEGMEVGEERLIRLPVRPETIWIADGISEALKETYFETHQNRNGLKSVSRSYQSSSSTRFSQPTRR